MRPFKVIEAARAVLGSSLAALAGPADEDSPWLEIALVAVRGAGASLYCRKSHIPLSSFWLYAERGAGVSMHGMQNGKCASGDCVMKVP
jgi:hypothetical protein